jgi:hypothetical protein
MKTSLKKNSLASFFFLFYLCTSVSDIYSQPKLQWQHCYGGSDAEQVLQYGFLTKTSDGGYCFVFGAMSQDSDVACNHRKFDLDIWVGKLSPSFGLEWHRCIGGTSSDQPDCVKQTSDGGYIIAGYTSSNDGDISDTTDFNTWRKSKIDAWAVKLDSLGNVEWDRRMGGSNDDELTSIVQTKDGGYIGAGYTWSNDEIWRGQSWVSHGWADAFVVKLDAKGNIQWRKLYGGVDDEGATSILQTSDGGYIFAGGANSRNGTGDVYGVHGDSTLDPIYHYNDDVWVVRLDTIGNMLWQKCYGGMGGETAFAMVAANDGGYVLGAITDSADGDVSKHYWNPDDTKEVDIWILMVDSVGNLIWERTFGGTNNDRIASIVQTSDGGYAFCGTTTSSDGDVKSVYLSGPDIWIGGLSPQGDLLWQETLGGTDMDFGQSIIQTDDRGFILLGETKSNDKDVSGNHGNADAWLAKLTALPSKVEAGAGGSNFAHPYPNPSASEMRLELFHSSPVREVHYFNLMGAEFFPDHRIENTTLVTDMQKLPSGMYVVRIIYSDPSAAEDVRKFLRVE